MNFIINGFPSLGFYLKGGFIIWLFQNGALLDFYNATFLAHLFFMHSNIKEDIKGWMKTTNQKPSKLAYLS